MFFEVRRGRGDGLCSYDLVSKVWEHFFDSRAGARDAGCEINGGIMVPRSSRHCSEVNEAVRYFSFFGFRSL